MLHHPDGARRPKSSGEKEVGLTCSSACLFMVTNQLGRTKDIQYGQMMRNESYPENSEHTSNKFAPKQGEKSER